MDIGVNDERDTGLVLRLGYSGQTGGPMGHRRPQTYPTPPGPSLTLGLSDTPGCPSADEDHAAELQNSSPSSAVSASFSTVKKDEEEAEKFSSRGSDEDEEDGGARKKLRLTKEQSALLEDRFKEHSTLNPKQKLALAKHLNLRPRQVEVWFQNRRARTKLKQTEVDCELLRRCCETLTDENRRLHRELQDLKALKLAKAAAPMYMQQLPAAPTMLTVCPSCERVVRVGDNTAKAAGVFSSAAARKTLFLNPFTGSATC